MNANCLSRLPLNDQVRNENDEIHEINRVQLESLPVSVEHVLKATHADPILSIVLEYTLTGWSTEQVDESIKQYFNKHHEMTVKENCLLWAMCIIIPLPLRERVLDKLHTSHPGIVHIKALSKIHVWWRRIYKNIASTIYSCLSRQSVRNKPPQEPLQPWGWHKTPWKRVHMDFCFHE